MKFSQENEMGECAFIYFETIVPNYLPNICPDCTTENLSINEVNVMDWIEFMK